MIEEIDANGDPVAMQLTVGQLTAPSATASALLIQDDLANAYMTFNTSAAQITVGQTLAMGANTISGSAFDITGGSATGLTAFQLTTGAATGSYLQSDASGNASWNPASGLGEDNTASNVGAAGVGVFKQKTGVNLEFKNINAGSTKVTVNDDTGNNEIDVDIAEANIVIGNLSGAPTGAVVGTTDTQTLTNKTISSASNTLTIPLNDLSDVSVAGVVEGQLLVYTGGSWISGGLNDVDYNHTVVNTATYTVLAGDEFIGVTYTTTGAVTITLPQISTVGKKIYTITDEGGNANANNITINTTGDTILGTDSVVINSNYNSITVYNNNTTGWFLK